MAKSIKIRSFELLQNWGLSILVLGWFIFVLAPFGPAVTFDSVSFLQAADNFYTTGHYVHSGPSGLEFAAHRFPIYPLLLSAFSFSKVGTFIFQVLLFSGTLVFFKKLISIIKAPPFLIIGLAFTGIIINYYCLWTEGLFGLLFMGLVYQLRLFESSKQVKWLLILISLLCLTRLVGVVVGGSLFLALISTKEYKTGRNLLITTIVVVGLWVTLGTLLLGSTAREFTFHLLTLNDFLDSFKSFAELFIPFEITGSVKMIIGFLLFLWPVGLLINSKRKHLKLSLTSLFLIIHFYAYFVFIWLSITFIDASIPLEYRTLFPIYLNFLALIACQLGGVVLEGNKLILRYLVPVLVLVLFTGTLKTTWQMRTEGIGYNASVWQTFEFTNVIKNIDAGLVHTNDKAAVLYYADNIREVRILPEIKSLYSLKENPLFDRQMGAVNTTLIVDEANYIIWVRNGITADVYPSYEALKSNKIYEVVYDDWLCLVLKYNFLK